MEFLGHKSRCQPPAPAAKTLNLLLAKRSGFFSLALDGGGAGPCCFIEELSKLFPTRQQQDETPTDVKCLKFLA